MTGNSPKIWAAANLDVISPAPLYPPSPIIIPTLQDQADTYFNMALNLSSNSDVLMTSAITNMNEVPDVNEQTVEEHIEAPALTTHDYTSSSAPDTGSVDIEITDPDKTVVSTAERVGTVSVGISTGEDMQERQTSQPGAPEAEQDVSKSNKYIHNSDAPPPVSHQVDMAASPHENSPVISQAAPEAEVLPPNLILQPTHLLPKDGQVVSSAAVPDAGAVQPSPSPTEYLPANNDQHSSTSQQAIDIQALVDSITAHAATTDAPHNPALEGMSVGDAFPQSSILPPKPPVPQQMSTDPHALSEEFAPYMPGASKSSNMHLHLNNGPTPGTYASAAAGMFDHCTSATVIPAATPMANYAISASQSSHTYGSSTASQRHSFDSQKQQWDTFLQEERKYISEAKWDRFPEGSRIFIGNLSSERVSKKEVFDIFSRYGRLAQISLKQAYGFVQYHTIAEGQAAMDNLQGIEVRGKKINLEFSRAQKKDGESNRGNRGKRDSDRQDGNRGRRDDYRPNRQPSPRRGNHRQQPSHDGNNRSRAYRESSYSSNRHRSQSPSYGSRDPYRRRSPSPLRGYLPATDPDLPRRYGADVPDVQFLLLQDVERDFVSWVQRAFISHGLRVDVMFLNPQFPRDAVIRHQVLEGVHAVVELDIRAQKLGKIPLQVFDRSAGYNNVRYDQYQDLDPTIAAQLVARTKSHSQIPPPAYGSSQYPPAQQYPPPTQGHYMPPTYPNQPYPSPIAPGAGGAPLDPAAIHKIFGSMNGQQGGPQGYAPPVGGPQVDVNALLATLSTASNGIRGYPTQHGTSYANSPTNMPPAGPHDGNPAQHVQDIMTQLARYRQ
ncbi:hypothetical protein HD806DRAFT_296859 [Xylariaceae sp. AK1471]|nr:hypothetical protein HD806DRAFT_296859 [Xylariaceae sp. AK1471]